MFHIMFSSWLVRQVSEVEDAQILLVLRGFSMEYICLSVNNYLIYIINDRIMECFISTKLLSYAAYYVVLSLEQILCTKQLFPCTAC